MWWNHLVRRASVIVPNMLAWWSTGVVVSFIVFWTIGGTLAYLGLISVELKKLYSYSFAGSLFMGLIVVSFGINYSYDKAIRRLGHWLVDEPNSH